MNTTTTPRIIMVALPLLFTAITAFLAGARAEAQNELVLKPGAFQHYIDRFNRDDEELYVQHIPNARAWQFLSANIPLFACPDKDIERTYYFRWWTYRKHIKSTPDGFVITEFLPLVGWAGKYNTINCAAGHHFYEGRWLHDPQYLNDYAAFWFRKGGAVRSYSFWAADALWARFQVTGDQDWIVGLGPDLIRNYEEWEKSRLESDGRVVPWIDENLNPQTGDWLSRTRLKSWKNGTWDAGKGGKERGKDYNHSTYCDLVISGLAGLRPRPDNTVEVNPLVPPDTWDWFGLDHVLYHGRVLTILWDKTGDRYGRGRGLRVFADGRQIAESDSLGRGCRHVPARAVG